VCLFNVPKPPPPPPPAPPVPEQVAKMVEPPKGLKEAQKLAGRMGTNSLVIPFQNVNVPS
jgi:hypothetical protein